MAFSWGSLSRHKRRRFTHQKSDTSPTPVHLARSLCVEKIFQVDFGPVTKDRCANGSNYGELKQVHF